MASGYFPLNSTDPHAITLHEAADEVEAIIHEYYSGACANNTPEDALADGLTLGQLILAVDFIRGAVECPREQSKEGSTNG